MMSGLLLIGFVFVFGAIAGWIGFFKSIALRRDFRRLQDDHADLRRRLNALAAANVLQEEPQPAAPAPELQGALPGPIEAAIDPAAVTADLAAADPVSAMDAAAPRKTRAGAGGLATALERRLAGNWLVWLGGAALVLGGSFLLKAAIDAGVFGPPMRILAALAAGAAMMTAGERLRRSVLGKTQPPGPAPAVLAGAGGAVVYGAIYAAYGLYEMIPAILALVLLAAAGAGLVLLAVVHRAPAVAGLGLAGAYLTPALTNSGEPSPAALFVFTLAVAACGFGVARLMRQTSVAVVAGAGALLWPLIWIAGGDSVWGAFAVAAYLPALLGVTAAFGNLDDDQPTDVIGALRGGLRTIPPPLRIFLLMTSSIAALAVLFCLSVNDSAWPATIALWAGLTAVSLAAAFRREAHMPAPLLIAAAFALSLAAALPVATAIPAASAFAAAFGAGGFLLVRRRTQKAMPAMLVAAAPIAILCALFFAVADLQQAPGWGVAAFALAFANLWMLTLLSRAPGGVGGAAGAASVYALGATLAAALGVAMAVEGLWMSAGLALQAPAIAALWRRFHLPALKVAAIAVATLASLRLLLLPEVLDAEVGPIPIFNALLPAYLAPALGFWIAARWFDRGGLAPSSATVQALEGAAFAVFAAFLSLQIRHALNAGDLGAPYQSLVESSLHIISWVLIAASVRRRFGASLTFARQLAERVLLTLSGATAFAGNLAMLNPWWGNGPDVTGAPLFNGLALWYLAPAAAFAAAALGARQSGALVIARFCAAAAALLAYAYVILSIRHAFHAPDLSAGGVTDGESWAYSIATILYASLILVAGAVRRSALLRYAGFGALILAVGKVFLVDTAGLEGVLRATSLLGLGAALIGVAVLYQRVLAPMLARDGPGQPPAAPAQ